MGYLDEILADGEEKLDVALQLTADDETRPLAARPGPRRPTATITKPSWATTGPVLQTDAVVAKYAECGTLTEMDGLGGIDDVIDRAMESSQRRPQASWSR